jgi:hypothetical protein
MSEDAADNLARYLDEGWDGTGWRPSALLEIGEAIIASSYVGPDPASRSHAEARRAAKEFRDETIADARNRYRSGFYANPFTTTPQRRPGT